MNCLDFRRLIGAEPNSQYPQALQHATTCLACADFAQRTRALDRKILQALQLPVPETFRHQAVFDESVAQEDGDAQGKKRTGVNKHRWLALAASLLIGVGIAAAMWLLFPRASLASDLVAHMSHEPQAWLTTDRIVASEELKTVLERSDVNADMSALQVSYAQTCWLHGRFVPHLVVQDDQGPLTVILLPKESVKQEQRFSESEYSGVILPVGQGSVAVLIQGVQDQSRINTAVEKIRALKLLGN